MTTYVTEHKRFGDTFVGFSPLGFAGHRDSGQDERLAIEFDNGLTLSMVWGWSAYCGPDTVEVAVLDEDGFLTQEIAQEIFGEDIGDDVDSDCDAERVHAYFVTVQNMREDT